MCPICYLHKAQKLPCASLYLTIFFIQFLNSVANGDVLMPTGIKVNLSDVYLFYTGSKYVPITYDFSKYVLEFKLNDSRNRFCPSCKTCDGCGKLIIPIVEQYEDMVEI